MTCVLTRQMILFHCAEVATWYLLTIYLTNERDCVDTALWKGEIVTRHPVSHNFVFRCLCQDTLPAIFLIFCYLISCWFFSWVNRYASSWKEKQTILPLVLLFPAGAMWTQRCWVPTIRGRVLLFFQLVIGQQAIPWFLQMTSSLICALYSLPTTSTSIVSLLEEGEGIRWVVLGD